MEINHELVTVKLGMVYKYTMNILVITIKKTTLSTIIFPIVGHSPLYGCLIIAASHPGAARPLALPPRYLPPAGSQTPVATADFNDSMAPSYPSSAEVHIMRYQLPDALASNRRTAVTGMDS